MYVTNMVADLMCVDTSYCDVTAYVTSVNVFMLIYVLTFDVYKWTVYTLLCLIFRITSDSKLR